MITKFKIDANRGDAKQVGLYIRADAQTAEEFRRLLWREGIWTVRLMDSRLPDYTHFTYASMPDQDIRAVQECLRPLCEANSTHSTIITDYDTWRTAFTGYVQGYRDQRIVRPASEAKSAFDKSHAYSLIENSRYAAAESYLTPFATDNPPYLLPAYLVYLYHQWQRPQDTIQIHARYADHFQAADVDHRVIEWIVAAYLHLDPPQPDNALMVLADFLPEFQRQGVSESLLGLRAQARAMQGKLPQTQADLRLYLQHTPTTTISEQVSDLLEMITGLSAPIPTVAELLDILISRIEVQHRWLVLLAKSDLAQRQGDKESALTHLRTILAHHLDYLDEFERKQIQLRVADLHLYTGRPQTTISMLIDLAPEQLNREEQQLYWQLLGLSALSLGEPMALDALRHAYESGNYQPEVLQSLARLAYQAEDWELARQVYVDLQQSGFTPRPEDHLYAGILAWLNGQPDEAVSHLQGLLDTPNVTLPTDAVALAYEAWVSSLVETEASPVQQAIALSSWTDWLVAQQNSDGLLALVERIHQAGFDRATTFELLEPLEFLLADHKTGKARLVQAYMNLFLAEVNEALRWERPLPDYVLHLRRALFELDRAQFDFAQEYLQEELDRAHQAELLAADFALEPIEEPRLDLSNRWVALVGGYAPVRRRVREKLVKEYGISQFTEVPPSWEDHIDQKRIAEAVLGADVIVVVHRCIKHDGSDALKSVIQGTQSENMISYARGKGHTSILQAITGFLKD